jgi:hypothetical protein
MYEYLNTPPDAPAPEYNCRGCGTPLYCAGVCWQCLREELYLDEIKELSRQDPREPFKEDDNAH